MKRVVSKINESRETRESGIFRIRSPCNGGLGLAQEEMLGS